MHIARCNLSSHKMIFSASQSLEKRRGALNIPVMLALEAMSYARFFAIEHTFHIALNASHDQQHATVCGERETVRRCTHDGWERQFK